MTPNMCCSRNSSGFTLVELMTTVAIIGVVTSISAPQFNQWTRRQALKSGGSAIREALLLARITAIGRNTNAGVQFSESDRTYTVFVDDGDMVLTSSDEVIRKATMPKRVSLKSSDFQNETASFNHMGFPRNGGSVSIEHSGEQKSHLVTLTASGVVKITTHG